MKKHQLALAIVAALGLSACGSDSDDNNVSTPPEEPVNSAPQAVADSAEVESGSSDSIDVLANDTDEDGDTLEITEVSDPENGTAEIADGAIMYTPNEGFLGDDSFTYTISDGEETAQAEVTVTVVDTVTVVGLITDEPIPFADISLTVDGETFEVQADENGRYELPVKIKNIEGDQVIRVTARGTEEGQTHVRLNSLLMSSTDLIETAGADGELTRDEFNDVNVTHVTTARDVLIRKAAEDEALTADNIDTFGNAIDPNLLVQMAAVVKLLTDDPETYALPDGVEDVESFIEDEEQYNTFVEEASQVPEGAEQSPLQDAIDETLEDPEVMPELAMEDLNGRYVEIGNTAPFFLPDASPLISFNGSTLEYYNIQGEKREVAVSLNGNRVIPDQPDAAIDGFSGFSFVDETAFDSQEALDAWVAYNGWDNFQTSQVQVSGTTELGSIDVINSSPNELVVTQTETASTSGFEFSYEGTTYTVIEPTEATVERTKRLVDVDSLKDTGLSFDLANQSTWFLPLLEATTGSTSLEGGLYNFAADGTWELSIYPEYPEAAIGSVDSDFLTGTWELSEDEQELTISSSSGEVALQIVRYRSEQEAQGVIVERVENNESTGMAQIRPGVAVDLTNIDFTLLEPAIGGDKILASIVNNRAPVYWDGNELLPSSWFIFELNEDGSGVNWGRTLCDGETINYGEICKGTFELDPAWGSPIAWTQKSFNGLEEVFYIDRQPNLDFSENERGWLPIAVSERDVVTLIEWNSYDSLDPEIDDLYIRPRYNMYSIQNKPPVAEEASSATANLEQSESISETSVNLNPLLGYKVVTFGDVEGLQSKH